MLVRDVTTRRPVTIGVEDSVEDARQMMKFEDLFCLLVMDRNNHLAGVVTELEMAKASPSPVTTLDRFEIPALLSRIRVEQIMERDFVTIDENASLQEAAQVLVDRKASVLPVMRGNEVIGVLTESDLIQNLREMLDAYDKRAA